jgi:hypothetical protein
MGKKLPNCGKGRNKGEGGRQRVEGGRCKVEGRRLRVKGYEDAKV